MVVVMLAKRCTGCVWDSMGGDSSFSKTCHTTSPLPHPISIPIPINRANVSSESVSAFYPAGSGEALFMVEVGAPGSSSCVLTSPTGNMSVVEMWDFCPGFSNGYFANRSGGLVVSVCGTLSGSGRDPFTNFYSWWARTRQPRLDGPVLLNGSGYAFDLDRSGNPGKGVVQFDPSNGKVIGNWSLPLVHGGYTTLLPLQAQGVILAVSSSYSFVLAFDRAREKVLFQEPIPGLNSMAISSFAVGEVAGRAVLYAVGLGSGRLSVMGCFKLDLDEGGISPLWYVNVTSYSILTALPGAVVVSQGNFNPASNLTMLDGLTGKVRWSRSDLPIVRTVMAVTGRWIAAYVIPNTISQANGVILLSRADGSKSDQSVTFSGPWQARPFATCLPDATCYFTYATQENGLFTVKRTSGLSML